jgi:tRNA (mo5U34)-methyltransferase
MYERFFRPDYRELVLEPNGRFWWHSMPLPDGTRVRGACADADINAQLKTWKGFGIAPGGLAGKTVLDIGANDGYYTIASLLSGAAKATAINSEDWFTYPHNLRYAADLWGVKPETLVGDYRTYPFAERYDVVLFLGVLYHLEDVFTTMKTLRRLLKDGGVLYIETQMSKVQSDLPVFESASDIYPTVARQEKKALDLIGVSNYLFPNHAAMLNLAYSYDFREESLDGPADEFRRTFPTRGLYKFTLAPDAGREGEPAARAA